MTEQNGHVTEKAINETSIDLSLQARATNDGYYATNSWFRVRSNDDLDIGIPPWWSEGRDIALRNFVKRVGNDILQGAISSIVKKIKSMDWYLSGPERTVSRYQKVLAQAEFGQGWSRLISKTIQPYLSQDKGAFWELIGNGDLDGAIVGPVLGVSNLDSGQIQPTGDPIYPYIYYNSRTKKPHKMHYTRIVSMVDLPSDEDSMLNIGFCAVSRVLASSDILLKLARYKNEKLDDLPESGLLIMNNIMPKAWEDARANYQRERRLMGQEYWANIMTFFSLDPTKTASADLISFSSLPDSFNELENTNLYVNILALAFGVDVREFWPMSAGPLGTASETNVQHQKAKGKGIGDLISTIEWAINWHILPPSIEFSFDFQDDDEDELRARINKTITETILAMTKEITLENGAKQSVSSRGEIRQMLANNVDYFIDEFLVDPEEYTDQVITYDQDKSRKYGKQITINSKGQRVRNKNKNLLKRNFDEIYDLAKLNYSQGKLSESSLSEFILSSIIDR